MHVRSRLQHQRLQISLIDTRRIDGKVRQEHVASLGSVPPDPSVQDRVAFWTKVHPRLSRLDNRLDPATRGRIMGELHKLVPMVPLDAAVADKVTIATRNVETSISLRGMYQGMIDDQKGLLAEVQRAIAEGEAAVAKADEGVRRDQEKLRRLEAGEDVPVRLFTYEDMIAALKLAGFTAADILRSRRIGQLNKDETEEMSREFNREQGGARERLLDRIVNRIHRRRAR
jgi:hypothetical protein